MQHVSDWLLDLQSWLFPAATLIVVLIVNQVIHILLKIRRRHTRPGQHVWRNALLWALDAPLRAIIWLAGIAALRQHFISGQDPLVQQFYRPAMGVLIIVVLCWFLLRLVNRVQANYITRARDTDKPVDYTAVDAISKLAWAFILIFAAASILQQIGISLAGLLAFGGAAGIAVGFAAQNLVANLFGGLTVYASRIFKIDEAIILPGSNLSGTVEQIGWRSTRVQGWDGRPFYVPNSLFNTSNVVNHTRMIHRTISEHLLLRYRDLDKVEAIVEEGNEWLEQRQDLSYFVFRFDGFGDAALKLYIYAWAQTTPKVEFLPYAEFMRIKEEVLLKLAGIAHEHGCELVLPISNLYLREGWPTSSREDRALADHDDRDEPA